MLETPWNVEVQTMHRQHLRNAHVSQVEFTMELDATAKSLIFLLLTLQYRLS